MPQELQFLGLVLAALLAIWKVYAKGVDLRYWR